MTKEVLTLALEALEELNNTNSYWWQEVDKQTIEKIEPAITAIKEALMSVPDGAQPSVSVEQEPVAIADGTFNHNCPVGTPLYTTPPQRTWVGLTLEDKEEYLVQDFGGNRLDAMDWAARKLKEKNT